MAPLAFEPWSTTHLLLVGLFAVGLVVMARWGASHRGTPGELVARRRFAVAVGLVWVAIVAYQVLVSDLDVAVALPLHVCDLALAATAVALWTRDERAAAFAYYVGLTLTVQGVLTPAVATGFPEPEFFGFWALHFSVVWAAVYLVWGLGIRPDWRLYRFSVLATLAWLVVVMAFNAVAGTNYGYLQRRPRTASLLDLMGPWPWYVVVAAGLVVVTWAVVLTLPWVVRERRAPAAAPTAPAPHPGPPPRPHR